jgi:hypothetical protein
MASPIIVTLDGEDSAFAFSKVDREKLYGKRERVVVDEEGVACYGASLTTDGGAIIPPGGLVFAYVDEAWDSLERSELKAVDDKGNPVAIAPSTLGKAQPLKGPIDASRLLDHSCTSVYELRPESVSSALSAKLTAGKIFETRFNYRDDYADSPAFLLGNDQGLFLLVCEPVGFEMLSREQAPALVVSDETEDVDDLDFGMM